jgi:hypothetical protein
MNNQHKGPFPESPEYVQQHFDRVTASGQEQQSIRDILIRRLRHHEESADAVRTTLAMLPAEMMPHQEAALRRTFSV